MTREITPLPCPFCGGQAEIFMPMICLGDYGWLRVQCRKCGARQFKQHVTNHDRQSRAYQSAKALAVSRWNQRYG